MDIIYTSWTCESLWICKVHEQLCKDEDIQIIIFISTFTHGRLGIRGPNDWQKSMFPLK